ncbi:MAG: 23S rRNA (pseudouridine(1915)-N(3))-methyltransferase RlmH [Saprospiraceae bacterium]
MELWWTGKTNSKYLNDGILEYQKRICQLHKFEIREFKESKGIQMPKLITKYEEEAISLVLDKSKFKVILLDEVGISMRSIEFSKWLEAKFLNSTHKFCFIIGGPYGFSDEFKLKADSLLSLSKMTLSHQLIRLVFLEQLYRALSIKNNLPYHHE